MAETLSLMEFLQALLADAELRGGFGDDPQGTLAVHGLADLTPTDVHDALVLVQDNETVDYVLDATTAPPPPPPAGDDHEAAVEYLARYLEGPQQAGPDEHWADPDADSAATPDVAPAYAAFGAGDDAGYGAGSLAHDAAWANTPRSIGSDAEPGTRAAADGGGDGDQLATYHLEDGQMGYDPGGYNLAEFDDFPGEDLLGEPDGQGPDGGGTALSEGA